MSLRRRLQKLLGLHQTANAYDNGNYDSSESYEEANESLDYEDTFPYRSERESNVIAMPGLSSFHSELVVMEPVSFQEVPAAIVALRERKVVVLNLSHMEGDEAQRSVDYVAGGTFALNGHQERIGKNVFLFTPHSVQITSQPQAAAMQNQAQAYPPPPPTHSPTDTHIPSGLSGNSGVPQFTQEQEMLRKLELRAGRTPPPPPPPRPRPRR